MKSTKEPEAKVAVNRGSLVTLMEWCRDAIDFENESDSQAAKAFEHIANEARMKFDFLGVSQ